MSNNCYGAMANNCCNSGCGTQMACMTPACGGCVQQMASAPMASAPMVDAPVVAVAETVATDSTFTAAPVVQEGAPMVAQEASPCGGCGMSVVGTSMGYDNCNTCGQTNGWNRGNNCCNTTYATGCNNGWGGSRTRFLGSRRSARCCY
jgi:hypothetical protein